MRFFTLAILCISLLLVAPLSASAKSKKDKGPEMIAKLLAKVIEAAGDRVSTETEVGDTESIGDGNEIVEIGEVNLTINIGDVVINSNESRNDGDNGVTELAFRLLDFMGMAHQQMNMGGGGHGGSDIPMHPNMDIPMGHPDMGMKQSGHGDGHPNMDGHGNMPMGHPNMDMPKYPGKNYPHDNAPMMGGSRGIGNPHGDMRRDMPNHENPGFHPEVWEMLQQIPMDVDPEFFGLMMHIAQMAWERPELRERLELMVRRLEEGENDRRPHGR